VKVKLYSTLSCPYCKMEKAWLDEKKIDHEVVYVDQNQQEAIEMVRKTGQMGVPVTEIIHKNGDPEFVIGFDVPRLSGALL
jgi:glutaredoxin 3